MLQMALCYASVGSAPFGYAELHQLARQCTSANRTSGLQKFRRLQTQSHPWSWFSRRQVRVGSRRTRTSWVDWKRIALSQNTQNSIDQNKHFSLLAWSSLGSICVTLYVKLGIDLKYHRMVDAEIIGSGPLPATSVVSVCQETAPLVFWRALISSSRRLGPFPLHSLAVSAQAAAMAGSSASQTVVCTIVVLYLVALCELCAFPALRSPLTRTPSAADPRWLIYHTIPTILFFPSNEVITTSLLILRLASLLC